MKVLLLFLLTASPAYGGTLYCHEAKDEWNKAKAELRNSLAELDKSCPGEIRQGAYSFKFAKLKESFGGKSAAMTGINSLGEVVTMGDELEDIIVWVIQKYLAESESITDENKKEHDLQTCLSNKLSPDVSRKYEQAAIKAHLACILSKKEFEIYLALKAMPESRTIIDVSPGRDRENRPLIRKVRIDLQRSQSD